MSTYDDFIISILNISVDSIKDVKAINDSR